MVEQGEECDDGNATCGDTCDPNCKTPGCGNNFMCSPEQCDDGNMTSFDGCSFPECCLEPPGPANMTLADKFSAADCFRNALKAEISAVSTLPPGGKSALLRRLDFAGSQQNRKCRGLRHALANKGLVCRRLDLANFLGQISDDEHLQIARKCAVLGAWYSSAADTEPCP